MKKKGKVNRKQHPEVTAYEIAMRKRIATNIKDVRETKKIKQKTLAYECKINERTMRKYENNECAIPHGILINIILALGTTYSKITGVQNI
jgi:transcriptional regulator with XRE-family HTH domain